MINKETYAFLYGVIAVALLVCLFDMPYGYYTLVRFVSMVAFAIFAYKAYVDDRKERAIVFLALALLFQPFIKLPLGRVIWNIVDVAVALYLLYCIVALFGSKK